MIWLFLLALAVIGLISAVAIESGDTHPDTDSWDYPDENPT